MAASAQEMGVCSALLTVFPLASLMEEAKGWPKVRNLVAETGEALEVLLG